MVAHFHYVLRRRSLFAFFGSVYFWLPEWSGPDVQRDAWQWHFWLSMIFFNVTFFPMHFSGSRACRAASPTTRCSSPTSTRSRPSAHSASACRRSVPVRLSCTAIRSGAAAPARPWEGADTLEWTRCRRLCRTTLRNAAADRLTARILTTPGHPRQRHEARRQRRAPRSSWARSRSFFGGIILAQYAGEPTVGMSVLGFAVLGFLFVAIGRNIFRGRAGAPTQAHDE